VPFCFLGRKACLRISNIIDLRLIEWFSYAIEKDRFGFKKGVIVQLSFFWLKVQAKLL
jgi:hypothetical protein